MYTSFELGSILTYEDEVITMNVHMAIQEYL